MCPQKEGEMSIVTISRGSYSHGREVAEALAEELKYQCVSREIVAEASEQYNIPEGKLLHALHDAPSFLDSFQKDREINLDYFKSSFFQHMLQGNIVYHGLAGHFFLQDVSHALKVRINAGMSERIEEEMRRDNCSLEEAKKRIKKDDRDRKNWSKQVYGADTTDSRLYDMVLCVDSLTVSDVVDILAKTVRKEQFQPTAQSHEVLQKLALQAKVKALACTMSPNARVRILSDSSVELYHLDGMLKTDIRVRDDLSKRVKDELNLSVVYGEPTKPAKDYVNTFYNLEVH